METKVERSPVYVNIKNFQSISNLDFVIDGFTCISGKSNIGKSAITRAIKSAITNRPVTGMVRDGTKFSSVELKSGTWGFKWEKGSGINRYTPYNSDGLPILEPDGRPKIYDKVGAGQIDEIAKLGFSAIDVGGENIYPWCASQFHPIFLLDKTGPAVTNFFSEVAHLEVLQNGVIICVRQRKCVLEEAKDKEAESILLQEKIQKFNRYERIKEITEDLELQAQSIYEYEDRIEREQKLFNEIETVKKIVVLLEQPVVIPQDSIGDAVHTLQKMNEYIIALQSIAQKVVLCRAIANVNIPNREEEGSEILQKIKKYEDVPKLQSIVETLHDIKQVKVGIVTELNKRVSDLRKAEILQSEIEELRLNLQVLKTNVSIPNTDIELQKLQNSETLYKEITCLYEQMQDLGERLKQARQEVQETQSEISKIPSCVSCGRPMASQHPGC